MENPAMDQPDLAVHTTSNYNSSLDHHKNRSTMWHCASLTNNVNMTATSIACSPLHLANPKIAQNQKVAFKVIRTNRNIKENLASYALRKYFKHQSTHIICRVLDTMSQTTIATPQHANNTTRNFYYISIVSYSIHASVVSIKMPLF
jgi:hypothetical protein